MDAVKAVARRIVPHARDVGRDIVGAAAHGVAPGQIADEGGKVGYIHDGRVDDEGRLGRSSSWRVSSEQSQRDRRWPESADPG